MKMSFFMLLCAAMVLGGCASAHVSDEDMALERKSKHQTIKHNQIVNDNDCVTADAAAKTNALATVSPTATSPAELTGLQHHVYQLEYERLKPDCVKGKNGASATGGGRYNVSAEELARMPLAAQCEYASTPMLMLMANEARNIDHAAATPGSSSKYRREALLDDCRRHAKRIERAREHELKQQRIQKYAEVEKYRIKRETPPFWARFIGPRHGYHGHSAVRVNLWYDRSGSREYRGSPGPSRQGLWKGLNYDRRGQHKTYRNRAW